MRALQHAANFLIERGYPCTFEDYLRSWNAQIKKFTSSNEELREPTFEEWYYGILEDLAIRDADRAFLEGLNSYFMRGFEGTTTLFPGVDACLLELRQKGYLLALVSNSLAENTNTDLERTGLANSFDLVLVSSEVRRRKPHPLVFQAALERLGISPEEGVFVGDDPWEDIYGAKRIGLKTILIAHAGYRDVYKDEDQRRKETADAVITDLESLVAALEHLF